MDYLVSDTDLTSVANAIRTKGGTSGQLEFPTGFNTAIANIPSGGSEWIDIKNHCTLSANVAQLLYALSNGVYCIFGLLLTDESGGYFTLTIDNDFAYRFKSYGNDQIDGLSWEYDAILDFVTASNPKELYFSQASPYESGIRYYAVIIEIERI